MFHVDVGERQTRTSSGSRGGGAYGQDRSTKGKHNIGNMSQSSAKDQLGHREIAARLEW